MQLDTNIIASVEQHVVEHFAQKMPDVFVYHDLQHTRNVVGAIVEIAEGYELTNKEMELLKLAAWFHDTGYDKGAKDHEQRSCQYARNFLQQFEYSEEDLDVICGCIMATKLPQSPRNLLEQIIGDADMSHLGKKNYWDRCGRVR
ncbi:MAG: HD domain-containing protein, partial [Bacteroidota bacterium]